MYKVQIRVVYTDIATTTRLNELTKATKQTKLKYENQP